MVFMVEGLWSIVEGSGLELRVEGWWFGLGMRVEG